MADLKEFQTYFRNLKGCCLKADAEAFVNDAVSVPYFVESEPDEASGAAIAKLSDGRFVVLQEWQDYTGHG